MNQPTANSSLVNNSAAPANAPLALPPPATSPASKPKRPRKPKHSARPSTNDPDRCRHYTSSGRRCRLPVLDAPSGLCFRHVGRQFHVADEDLSPAFVGLLSGFRSAARIHAFLTQLTVLLVQNRVSTRRAAILAYLGQTLLRTLPAIDQQEKAAKDAEPDSSHHLPPHLEELIEYKRAITRQQWLKNQNLAQPANSSSGPGPHTSPGHGPQTRMTTSCARLMDEVDGSSARLAHELDREPTESTGGIIQEEDVGRNRK